MFPHVFSSVFFPKKETAEWLEPFFDAGWYSHGWGSEKRPQEETDRGQNAKAADGRRPTVKVH